jgi:putative Ca2+/H+ antiporter (TMEM165/GDT1 family)
MLEVFLTSYGGVFIAEIVGDKLLYTSGVLGARYRWGPIVCGMALAFMAKMSVAVAAGLLIGRLLPTWLVAVLTAVSFVGVAITMWRRPDVRTPTEKDSRLLRGASVAFLTIFLSEWGDKGMVTAGNLAAAWATSAVSHGSARSTVAWLVWLGAVMAMVTKGSLAVTLGAGVRLWIANHVSPRYVRYSAVAAMVVLGLLSVLEVLGILTD